MATNHILLSEFQPIHNLHEDFIKKHIAENTHNQLSEILFCIDWAYRKIHADSPLSTKEREDMIHILMEKYPIKYNIIHLPDSDNDIDRLNSITHLFTPLSWKKIWSDDKKTYNLLSSNNIDCELLPDKGHTQSTIRNQFAAQNLEQAEKKLPREIYNYLIQLWVPWRMKKEKIHAFWWPNVATDIIIRNEIWEIAIIERRDEPFWYALPGGMIDRWEFWRETAARESKEETWATGEITSTISQNKILENIKNLGDTYNISISPEQQPFHIQTSPTRDMRGHIMTLAYIMDYNGQLEKWDDAKSVKRVSPQDALQNSLIPQSHKEIIIAYIAHTQ